MGERAGAAQTASNAFPTDSPVPIAPKREQIGAFADKFLINLGQIS